MNPRLTLATADRVLRQIRHDPRTIALLVLVPCVLIGLLAWVYDGTAVFDRIGAPLLGVFPFVVMFLVTSVATLRERQSGTLERPAPRHWRTSFPERETDPDGRIRQPRAAQEGNSARGSLQWRVWIFGWCLARLGEEECSVVADVV